MNTIGQATPNPVEQAKQAWELCDATREYAKNAGREIRVEEMLEKVIMPSPLVDIERTRRECGNQPTKVFLKSPYGIEYRPDIKHWVPFRHGEVKLPHLSAGPPKQ